MSAVKITARRYDSQTKFQPPWFTATCRRCGAWLASGRERRRLKREAETRMSEHICDEEDAR